VHGYQNRNTGLEGACQFLLTSPLLFEQPITEKPEMTHCVKAHNSDYENQNQIRELSHQRDNL